MEQTPLAGQKREVLGRKVKTLRKQGILPAHIFGHQTETIHIQVNGRDFAKVFEKAGETGVIDLKVDGESHPVLIRDIQLDPITGDFLHVDFYQVNLLEKVKVNVPLEITGEAPAVEKKIGLMLTPVSEVEVEALPTDIPETIQVDVSTLANIGDVLKVSDLKVDRSKVEIQVDPELVIVQIGELVTKEMEAVEAEAEAAAAAAEVPEGAEGEEKTEGEEGAEGEAAGGEPRPEGREKAEGVEGAESEAPEDGDQGKEAGEDKGGKEEKKDD